MASAPASIAARPRTRRLRTSWLTSTPMTYGCAYLAHCPCRTFCAFSNNRGAIIPTIGLGSPDRGSVADSARMPIVWWSAGAPQPSKLIVSCKVRLTTVEHLHCVHRCHARHTHIEDIGPSWRHVVGSRSAGNLPNCAWDVYPLPGISQPPQYPASVSCASAVSGGREAQRTDHE